MNRICKNCIVLISVSLVALILSSCVAPALMLAPQSQLMWALLKPMVGLDPKEANLFRQPLIQSRLEPLLGNHYGGAVQLLETADKIQQEGPLFYVVSKYTPVPELAEKAGFVWNSETNQMAVLLVSGGAPQVFAEKLNSEIAQQVPVWPSELSDYTDPTKIRQQALSQAKSQIAEQLPVPAAIAPVVEKAEQLKNLQSQTKNLVEEKKQALIDQASAPVREVKQQTESIKTQLEESVKTPMQTATQQLQKAEEKTKREILTPITDSKQKSEQQLHHLESQATQSLTAPLLDQSKQAEAQVKPAKTEDKETLVKPATDLSKKPIPQAGLVNAATTAVTATAIAAEMQRKQKEAVSPSPSKTPVLSSAETENDLEAELAAEQQALSAEKLAKTQALQDQIAKTTQQLTQTSDANAIRELQLTLQRLKANLAKLNAVD